MFVNEVGVKTVSYQNLIKNNKLTVSPRLQLGLVWGEGWD